MRCSTHEYGLIKICTFHTSTFSCSSSAKNTAARSSALFLKRGEKQNRFQNTFRDKEPERCERRGISPPPRGRGRGGARPRQVRTGTGQVRGKYGASAGQVRGKYGAHADRCGVVRGRCRQMRGRCGASTGQVWAGTGQMQTGAGPAPPLPLPGPRRVGPAFPPAPRAAHSRRGRRAVQGPAPAPGPASGSTTPAVRTGPASAARSSARPRRSRPP